MAAFLTGANLIMEYVFSNAAVARSFTAYLGTAVGVDAPSQWRITVHGLPEGFNQVDLVAVGVILLISVCICYRYAARARSSLGFRISRLVMSGSIMCHRSTQVFFFCFIKKRLSWLRKGYLLLLPSVTLAASSCVTLRWLPACLCSALVGSGTMRRKGTPGFCALESKCTTLSCPVLILLPCGCMQYSMVLLRKYS